MTRTFYHFFNPPSASPIASDFAELTVDEIEDAGIREVLQTPGAALGSWAVLDGLLEPSGPGSLFVFREPLGQAREVKVSLSGLFGRFVARAYLERYLGLSLFAHLGQREILLDGRLSLQVVRKSNGSGDLPDWVAADANLSTLTVAEAKGCHDNSGPQAALNRAWQQANRIDIVGDEGTASVKRVAIAIRWGAALGGASTPILVVRDPKEEGDMPRSELEAALVGVARLHAANLLKGLGHIALGQAFAQLAEAGGDSIDSATLAARTALGSARGYTLRDQPSVLFDGLIGNWITRAGPIPRPESFSDADQQALICAETPHFP